MSDQPSEPSPSNPALCPHRWRIAPPNGPTSAGVCQRCGATRDFANVSDEHVWDNTTAGYRSRPAGFKRPRGR